jgi:anti-anti-sigma factor
MYLTDLLRNLPDVVLAAIVLVAVKGLVNIPELRRTFALSRVEFWVAMVAFAGVLLLGILKGVLLAAIVSVLLLVRRAAVPRVVPLGRVPGSHVYADRLANPGTEEVPGVLIVRVGGGLLYFNAGHVSEEVKRLVAAGGDSVRLVVWDLSTSPYVDIAGARMLADLLRDLSAAGIELRLAEAHASVRELVQKEGGGDAGDTGRRLSVDEVIESHARPSAAGAG